MDTHFDLSHVLPRPPSPLVSENERFMKRQSAYNADGLPQSKDENSFTNEKIAVTVLSSHHFGAAFVRSRSSASNPLNTSSYTGSLSSNNSPSSFRGGRGLSTSSTTPSSSSSSPQQHQPPPVPNTFLLTDLLDTLGTASARAQGLGAVITTGQKLASAADQRTYIAYEGSYALGFIKVGPKQLYLTLPSHVLVGGGGGGGGVGGSNTARMVEITPLCVLDFFVYESYRRKGVGKLLFESMLYYEGFLKSNSSSFFSGSSRNEHSGRWKSLGGAGSPYTTGGSGSDVYGSNSSNNGNGSSGNAVIPIHPALLGYDRPSVMFLSFLRKYYGLHIYTPQANNYVIFHEYFSALKNLLQTPFSSSSSFLVSKTLQHREDMLTNNASSSKLSPFPIISSSSSSSSSTLSQSTPLRVTTSDHHSFTSSPALGGMARTLAEMALEVADSDTLIRRGSSSSNRSSNNSSSNGMIAPSSEARSRATPTTLSSSSSAAASAFPPANESTNTYNSYSQSPVHQTDSYIAYGRRTHTGMYRPVPSPDTAIATGSRSSPAVSSSSSGSGGNDMAGILHMTTPIPSSSSSLSPFAQHQNQQQTYDHVHLPPARALGRVSLGGGGGGGASEYQDSRGNRRSIGGGGGGGPVSTSSLFPPPSSSAASLYSPSIVGAVNILPEAGSIYRRSPSAAALVPPLPLQQIIFQQQQQQRGGGGDTYSLTSSSSLSSSSSSPGNGHLTARSLQWHGSRPF